ncbi:MAG: Immunoglobulin-like domain of bacterial spore germination [Chloroflexi bacterium]|nr:Immunoglobulin-like domain of bacterial spore germination [Chloroflexota bacterium]
MRTIITLAIVLLLIGACSLPTQPTQPPTPTLRPSPQPTPSVDDDLFSISPPRSPVGARYTAKPGETLTLLAERFGIRVEELVGMNPFPPDAAFPAPEPLVLPYGVWSRNLNIRVTEPDPAVRISNPIRVDGSAATSDGAIFVEVIGPGGTLVAQGSTKAEMPGPDHHGPFTVVVAIPADRVDDVTLLRIRGTDPSEGDEILIPLIFIPS